MGLSLFLELVLIQQFGYEDNLISSLCSHLKTLHWKMPPTFLSENSLGLFLECLRGIWKIKRSLMNGQKFQQSCIASSKKQLYALVLHFPFKYWFLNIVAYWLFNVMCRSWGRYKREYEETLAYKLLRKSSYESTMWRLLRLDSLSIVTRMPY